MKKVLLIEDDAFKAQSIISLLIEVIPGINVESASSLVEAVRAITAFQYDLILVDMAIPSHPTVSGGGSPMSLLSGGLEVILELKSLDRYDPCVIITQYPEIEITGQFYPLKEASKVMKNSLDCDVLDCIEYSDDSDEWKAKLSKILGLI